MSEALVFDTYEKALATLKLALDEPLDDFIRDSAIQRFEYSIELSWKTLRRYLIVVYNIEEGATREIFRIAERNNIIDDALVWIDYVDKRNMTSHTYHEDIAAKVYETAQKFYGDAIKLLQTMKDGYARHKGQ